MEPKTFVALTDEQLVVLSWAMDLYCRTVHDGQPPGPVVELGAKMKKHAISAWDRLTNYV